MIGECLLAIFIGLVAILVLVGRRDDERVEQVDALMTALEDEIERLRALNADLEGIVRGEDPAALPHVPRET